MRKQTDRFGERNNSENYNGFLENIHRLGSSSHGATQEESNGILVNTLNRDENQLKSSSDQTNQFLQLLLTKIDAIENFLIGIKVQLDNTSHNERLSNNNQPTEIDIGELQKLGLPAESGSDIKKLEENLKNEDFRTKLVSKLMTLSYQFKLIKIVSLLSFLFTFCLIVFDHFFIYNELI